MLETALAGEGEADLIGHCAAEGALGRDKGQSETDPLLLLTLHRGHQPLEPQKDAWESSQETRGEGQVVITSLFHRGAHSTPNAICAELKGLLRTGWEIPSTLRFCSHESNSRHGLELGLQKPLRHTWRTHLDGSSNCRLLFRSPACV